MAPAQAGNANRNSYRCKSPNTMWLSFSRWYIRTLSNIFAWTSSTIAHHPWITIFISLAFVGFCSVGLVWLHPENRAEKLFIPQDSRAIKDLERAEKHFTMDSRIETVIFTAKQAATNILSSRCMSDVLKVHETIARIPSYRELCVEALEFDDYGGTCLFISPLEIFHFNRTKLVNIKQTLEAAFRDRSLLMRNGRAVWYNFGVMFGGVEMNKTTGEIDSISAIQVSYIMKKTQGDQEHDKIMEWEKRFIDGVAEVQNSLACMQVHATAQRSLDDAIGESTGTDITFISVTYCLMISFACTMLGKFRNPLTGHSLLANAGIITVFLGILAGFGFTMLVQTPFVSIAGALPFLIIGIGIDDMFIIVDELDRISPGYSVADTVKIVMANTGATVTMTTMTDLVAFAVSTTSELPAIRYFCTYAALAITFSYLMIVTFFVALMSFDVRRVKSGRRDCLPICRAPRPKQGAPPWDEPRTQPASKIMTYWSHILMRTEIKCVVVIISLALFGCGIYGTINISEEFDPKMLARDDSPFLKFNEVQEQYFERTIAVNIIVDEKIDYSDPKIQKGILELTNIASRNSYYKNSTMSWMRALMGFSKRSNLSITGEHFIPTLQRFLKIPAFRHFLGDIRFSRDGRGIQASRVMCYIKGSLSSIGQRDAMVTIRRDIDTLKAVPAYPITKPFLYFEQYAITLRATVRNLVIASIAILIITTPFLIDLAVTILVFFGFVALVFELFGLMYIWGVSLNGISMINLIMAIGFAVDYSAHIAHAYVMSSKVLPEDRVVDALRTLGASVLMGGASTFVGMVMLAFASSQIFRIFFKMFFGIVFLGLLHGLCFLPVYLTIFCRAAPLMNTRKRHAGASEGATDSHEMNGIMNKQPIDMDSAFKRLSENVPRDSDGSSSQSPTSPTMKFDEAISTDEDAKLCPKGREGKDSECDDGERAENLSSSSLPPPDLDRETIL